MNRMAAKLLVVLLCAASVTVSAPQVKRSRQRTQEQVDAAKAAAAYAALRSGLAALAQGKQQQARQYLEQATRLLPWWPEPHNLLAFVYQQQGDRTRARQEYEAALRSDPGNIHARAALAALTPETVPGAQNAPETAQQEAPEDQSDQVRELEDFLVELVNHERVSRGLVPLQIDERLRLLAREHSVEMRDLGYFDHSSPVKANRSLMDRYLQRFAQRPVLAAENISRRWGYGNCLSRANLEKSHHGLMRSSGHRQNILNPRLTHIGVGIAANAQGDYWITEDFARFHE